MDIGDLQLLFAGFFTRTHLGGRGGGCGQRRRRHGRRRPRAHQRRRGAARLGAFQGLLFYLPSHTPKVASVSLACLMK